VQAGSLAVILQSCDGQEDDIFMSKALIIDDYMTASPETIGPKASLAEAHATMRRNAIRHLPVVNEGELLGIVTMRDLHLLETLPDIDQDEVPVEDAMTEDPYVVEPGTPLKQVSGHMADNKYGAAIVVRGDEILGVFTTVDALRALHDVLSEA
jgi:acetoin utilization protein AcuB